MKKLILLALLCTSPLTMALGIGAAKIHSALGEPLMIEITLTGASDLSDEQMQFSIAPLEQYRLMGVELLHSHQQLRFSTVRDRDRNPILLVSTTQPFREPYLHFVLQVITPKDRNLKEISLLLDTPSL